MIVFANSVQGQRHRRTPSGKERAADVLRRAAEESDGRLRRRAAAQPVRRARPARLQLLRGHLRRPRRSRGDDPKIVDRRSSSSTRRARPRRLVDALCPAGDRGTCGRHAHPDVGAARMGATRSGFHATYVPIGRRSRRLPTTSSATSSTPTAPHCFPRTTRSRWTRRSDQRGRLVETVRSHGSGGQTFVSTTVPGVTRGEHYHLHKIERFVVLDGEAVICAAQNVLRPRCSSSRSPETSPCADRHADDVGAQHHQRRRGRAVTTLFWTDTLFDPEAPRHHPRAGRSTARGRPHDQGDDSRRDAARRSSGCPR